MLKENIERARLAEGAEAMRCRAEAAVKRFSREGRMFDLIFLDPPYRLWEEGRMAKILEGLVSILHPDGIIILQCPTKRRPHLPEGLRVVGEREMGDTTIILAGLARGKGDGSNS